MTNEQIEKYSQWRKDLITIAVSDFGYAYDVIEPLVNGHAFQEYFEGGDTPYQALQSDELQGL